MATITIRNLPDDVHRKLKLRAKQNGRSLAAEVRDILNKAVNPPPHLKLGTESQKFGKLLGGQELRIERDETPAGSTVNFD